MLSIYVRKSGLLLFYVGTQVKSARQWVDLSEEYLTSSLFNLIYALKARNNLLLPCAHKNFAKVNNHYFKLPF